MIEAADEHGFPLFEVPYEVPFIAVTEKAFTHLVNEHYAVLQRALSAHERLERIVLSERGLDGVAGALASLIGGPAIIFDARGEVLARRAAREPLHEKAVAALADELRERAAAGGRRGYAPGGELAGRALALPVPRTPQGTAPGGRRPGAAGVARGGQGRRRADRVRPPRRCTRPSPSWRSSCSAAASPTTPSAGSPATCSPRWCPASSTAASWRAGWSRSACATAPPCSCSPRRAR